MAKNSNLHSAREAKNDEFYTQRADIENELKNYKEHFKGKVVYCNCDDPDWSHFFRYFADNFEYLGLKKLICTHYEKDSASYKLIIEKDKNKDKKINRKDVEKIEMMFSDGDFRSTDCIELLKEADIVCTNPPFSLFREYVAQLIEYNKKFLIIGNDNCRTYKEVFKLIKENKIWCGYNHVKSFLKTNGEFQNFGNVSWYTNLSHNKRNEKMILYKKYNPKEYPKYDNYDAINVDKVADIPCDYYGVMGVPITFLDKYNPNQFEIVAFRKGEDGKDLVFTRERERVQPFFRILVQRVSQE